MMNVNRFQLRLVLSAAGSLLLLLIIAGIVALDPIGGAGVVFLGLATLVPIIGISVAFLKVFYQNPTSLRVALIGPSGCGKTVYLATLFSEVHDGEFGEVGFQAYGRETIEQALVHMEKLQSREWPSPTSMGEIVPYRAKASVKLSSFLSRKYTVEIGDYAGEHIDEFDPSGREWLHRTKYFTYAVQSDVVFLATDAETLCKERPEEMARAESELVAVLQILIDEKGIDPPKKLAIPVVLIVLKSDLLPNDDRGEYVGCDRGEHAGYDRSEQARHRFIETKFSRLLSLAKRRCARFQTVFVSSVGEVDDQGQPSVPLQPRNVVEPLKWALIEASRI